MSNREVYIESADYFPKEIREAVFGKDEEDAPKKRIMVMGFRLETNTFSPHPATVDDYKNYEFYEGEKVLDANRGISTEIGGYIDVLEKNPDVELIGAYHANTIPRGPITREAFDYFVELYLDHYRKATAEAPIDGLLFAFHGAMVVEDYEDGEGEFLRRVRAVVGPDMPIILTLDFHANITEEMVTLSNAMFTARYYPHTDFFDRGVDAAHLMEKMLFEGARPIPCFKRIPLIYPHMGTGTGPLKTLIPKLLSESDADPAVYGVYFIAGFCRSDISVQGSCIYALTENDAAKAKALCDKYYADVMEHLPEYKMDFPEPAKAVRDAMEFDGLTVLIDGADNPGSGLMGDATEIIHELLRQGATNVGIAAVADPETVKQAFEAGVGATIHVRLGGKSSPLVGAPVEVDAKVLHLSDGEVVLTGPMSTGMTRHCGPSATLEFNGIKCVVVTKRNQTHDEQMFRYNGVEPLDLHIIVLKTIVHFRAAYEKIADRIVVLDLPNLTPIDDTKIEFKHVTRPIYPLDEIH